jgi:hypothetical protein
MRFCRSLGVGARCKVCSAVSRSGLHISGRLSTNASLRTSELPRRLGATLVLLGLVRAGHFIPVIEGEDSKLYFVLRCADACHIRLKVTKFLAPSRLLHFCARQELGVSCSVTMRLALRWEGVGLLRVYSLLGKAFCKKCAHPSCTKHIGSAEPYFFNFNA